LGEGAAHLSAALRLNPGNPEAHDNLGLALLELNHPREAADHFSAALRLNPEAPGAQYHLALALVRQDKPKEALSHAQKARGLALAAGQPALAAKAEELLKQCR
jgi:cytochrome c-type biogenesis protein CcmH/NrfG